MELTDLAPRLSAFVTDSFGRQYEIGELAVSDGHAGLTFLFSVTTRGGDAQPFVIKMPPKGVRYRDNTDVYRQAVLLRALHAAGFAVPEVAFAYQDNAWFETPFMVMRRLAGRVFFVWAPHASFSRDKREVVNIWQQCLEQLPRIHQFDWQKHLADWSVPRPLSDDVARWRKIYSQAPEPAWYRAAEDVESRLADSLTADHSGPQGLFHGDYQPGNILYQAGRLEGIIDWELAGIGAQLIDVGWLMMLGDEGSWIDEWRPLYAPSPDVTRRVYEKQMGQHFPHLAWYQAFASYRLGSIACLNVKLHRRGQRSDPVWEKMGLIIPHLFRRAAALLA